MSGPVEKHSIIPPTIGPSFVRKNGILCVGNISLTSLAKKYGTPLYIYDFEGIFNRAVQITRALKIHPKGSRAFYAVKALSNLSVIKLMHDAGLGMDVVSQGELERCLAAGVPARDIIFSGVGKTQEEINRAVEVGIHCINLESPFEIERLKIATDRFKKKINVSLRINPSIDARTHSKTRIAKMILASSSLELIGLSCHLGSQIHDLEAIKKAALQLKNLSLKLIKLGASITHVDMGGGLGVPYHSNDFKRYPSIKQWIDAALLACPDNATSLYLEPGRVIVAESGALITKVIDIKHNTGRNFAIVDAGMTELIRPALYESYHRIENVKQSTKQSKQSDYEVVGPVCESSCWLGKNVKLANLKTNDILAVFNAGAYAASMASNYNTRPLVPEIAVKKGQAWIIRRKEPLSSIWEFEQL
jgi:diaminopimelate decarboxylase